MFYFLFSSDIFFPLIIPLFWLVTERKKKGIKHGLYIYLLLFVPAIYIDLLQLIIISHDNLLSQLIMIKQVCLYCIISAVRVSDEYSWGVFSLCWLSTFEP